jgi:hypothetical protein
VKKSIVFAVILALAIFSLTAAGADFKYVGSEKCKMCHKTEKQGNQFGIWEASAHAKAFATLASEESKKIAAKMEIADPQKSDKCLVCHVTAFGVADSLKDTTLTLAEGVGCEVCHGPGSDYKKMSTMKDRAKAIEAGLLIPDEKTCLKCHNETSPTYKPFKYAERQAQIAHPTPKATE